MLNKKLEEALNAQINAEFWSAYLYLSMSSDMSDKGMAGVANWFAIQFKEEQDHAMKFAARRKGYFFDKRPLCFGRTRERLRNSINVEVVYRRTS